MTHALEHTVGRVLIAALFIGGSIQKAINPTAAQALLAGVGLPTWLVWPAFVFNAAAAVLVTAGWRLRLVGRALALYCITTSIFHFVPSDPWQMSIFVKNWAIAGGCLILSATPGGKRA